MGEEGSVRHIYEAEESYRNSPGVGGNVPSSHPHTPLHRISNCPWALESIHTSSQENFPLSEVLFCFVLFLTLNLVKLKKSFDILSHLIFEVDRPHVLPLMLQSGKSRAGEFKRLAQGNFANICRDLILRLVSYSPGLLLLQLSGHSILDTQGPLMGLLEIWILALLEATCVTLNKTL